MFVHEHVAYFNIFRFDAFEEHDVSLVKAVFEGESNKVFFLDVICFIEGVVAFPPFCKRRLFMFHAAAHNCHDGKAGAEEESKSGVNHKFDKNKGEN